MKLPKMLQKYAWLIDSIDDMRASGNGIWVYLKPGHISPQGTHQVHEDTIHACAGMLRCVTPCDCSDCKEAH